MLMVWEYNFLEFDLEVTIITTPLNFRAKLNKIETGDIPTIEEFATPIGNLTITS